MLASQHQSRNPAVTVKYAKIGRKRKEGRKEKGVEEERRKRFGSIGSTEDRRICKKSSRWLMPYQREGYGLKIDERK